MSTLFPAWIISTARDLQDPWWIQPWKLSLYSLTDHSCYFGPEQRDSCWGSWVIARTLESDSEFNWPKIQPTGVFRPILTHFKIERKLQRQSKMSVVSHSLELAFLNLYQRTASFDSSGRRWGNLVPSPKWTNGLIVRTFLQQALGNNNNNNKTSK